MHNVIVGTAGHVDHGKTCLIKALTGIETDRLQEEKKRGITIDLGFADMPNDCGQHIGIIDVPGHERFVRNMLAGIGGIDLVLLVVAADEGVMPQTVEHFEILKMLGIKRGIVVLTKADLVDGDWLELVAEDVRATVAGTFLEDAPLLAVSSHTGRNIEELKQLICRMAAEVQPRKEDPGLLRIPIDRVFTIGGFGTVITGTLTEGSISVGDEVQIYPGERTAKVRSLQVHGHMVDTAFAGQRTAVNLMNLKKEDLGRGNVLAAKGSLRQTMMLDVRIRMFDDARRVLQNDSRVHLYYGSAEALCKVVLLDRETLESGSEGYAQLRLEEPVAVRKGDRFVIRFYSPVETIGGGEILDPAPPRHKRFRTEILDGLRVKEQGGPAEVFAQALRENRRAFRTLREIGSAIGLTETDREQLLEDLLRDGRAIRFSDDLALHADTVREFGETARAILADYHSKQPIAPGVPKGEFRKRLADKAHIGDSRLLESILRHLLAEGTVEEQDGRIRLPGFTVSYTEEHRALRDRLEATYKACGFQVPELDEAVAQEANKPLARQMAESMAAEGLLHRIDFQHYMHRSHWDRAMDLFWDHMETNGRITLAEYRDLLGASRKYAVLILDYLDERKVTSLEGEARVLLPGAGKER